MNEYVKCNPLLTTKDVNCKYKGTEVIGVFNPASVEINGETVLLVRIAERVKTDGASAGVPMILDGKYTVRYFDYAAPEYDFSDSRLVKGKKGKYLTSMSYLAVARSLDGEHFAIDTYHGIFPETEYESYGVEDARISVVEGKYYITYTAVSEKGICVGLATTEDFKQFRRLGVLLTPDNKDAVLFPEKIGGKYYMIHRPSTSEFGKPEIWLSSSENLTDWGGHKRLLGVRETGWDSVRIGACVSPVKTEDGWLLLYHGADENNRYCVGGCLLDLENPERVLKRSEKPFLEPVNEYEKEGFFGGVVFPCGCVEKDGKLRIYYGSADDKVCRVDTPIADIADTLK